MNLSFSLDQLAHDMQALRVRRDELSASVSNLLFQWRGELAPLLEFMGRNKIPFGNAKIDGTTQRGILLGDGFIDGKRVFYVYEVCFLRTVDAATDQYAGRQTIETVDFLETCDLEKVKAGFDYVRNLNTTAAQWYHQRNQALERFLKDNQ